MKSYCTHCRSDQHWVGSCPNLSPSHGDPRADAHDPHPKPSVPRRIPGTPRPVQPVDVTKTPPADVPEVIVTKNKGGRPKTGSALSAAERKRRSRAANASRKT